MRKNLKGFTLIELMIVIAIIAILVAIALPAFNNYQESLTVPVENAELVYESAEPREDEPAPAVTTGVRCMSGYLFMINPDGSAKQILDANGGGAVCDPSQFR